VFGITLYHNNHYTQRNKIIIPTSPDSILPKWDDKIDDWIIEALKRDDEWIIEALKRDKRLGRNMIYRHVDKRYKKARHKTKSLSKEVFDEHLKFLIQNGIVDKNDVGQKGTKIDHFLTPGAIQQLQMGTLDLRTLKNQNKKKKKNLVKITPQMKFKALYILILMFNHTTPFEFRNEDELVSFLAPFHLKLDKPSIARLADEHESEEAKNERRLFETRIESQDRGVTVSIHDYVNRYHGGTTSVYNCQIRGMTKETVISNRINKPFQYLSFTSNQLNEAFDLLCKDQVLRLVPQFDGGYIYRIVNNESYFLLFFLEDLFTDNVMLVLRNIWKYIRNPTPEERGWLTLLEGGIRADKIIIDEYEHRREMENGIRRTAGGVETVTNKLMHKKRIEKINEIESQVKSMQEELNNYMKTYEFIINKHKSLQSISEIMFPEFLRRLELRSSVG
jgi:DNA-binding HxlR family transcriptional regulator